MAKTATAAAAVAAIACLVRGGSLAAQGAVADPAPGDDPVGILERAEALYRGTDAFCADFRQELSVPLLNQERTSTGRLCQQRPNLFSMRFTDPEGDAVVADGTWLWIYYPSVDPKQVLRSPLAAGSGSLDFHREFLEDPGTKYVATHQGRQTLGGRPVHRIALSPRGKAPYQAAVVWIDVESHLVRQVEIQEENGSMRRVSLTGIDLGADPPAGAFRFTPPPGAQVISR